MNSKWGNWLLWGTYNERILPKVNTFNAIGFDGWEIYDNFYAGNNKSSEIEIESDVFTFRKAFCFTSRVTFVH